MQYITNLHIINKFDIQVKTTFEGHKNIQASYRCINVQILRTKAV